MDPLSRAAALAIVFGLLALFVWVMKRSPGRFGLALASRAKTVGEPALAVDGAIPLSAQHRLHIVRWQHKCFLVLTGPGGGSICPAEPPPSFLPALAEALGSAQDAPKEQA
jgi:hypothetical protein